MRDVRGEFPTLRRDVKGRRLVYLDSAATSLKPQSVIDAIGDYYANHNSNVHRSVHMLAGEATSMYESARSRIAKFLGVGSDPIVFTKNASESINLVARSWGDSNVAPGDRILVTLMEHHSNIIPWFLLAERTGAKVEFVDIDDEGRLDLEDLRSKLDGSVKLVGVTHVSNVLGTINPIEEVARFAHDVGALVLVDGAQAAPHMPVDIASLGCDFYAATAHKMCGPTGVGFLWGRRELLEAMPPFLGGGEMIKNVTVEGATYAEIPYKFEAGTPPIGEAIAAGAAVDYLTELDMAEVRVHEEKLVEYALTALEDAFGEGITIFGPSDPRERGGAVSFTFFDVHPHDLATILDEEGVAIRAGHHCAKPLMNRLEVAATGRASFYVYNTEEDVDALVKALHVAGELFRVT